VTVGIKKNSVTAIMGPSGLRKKYPATRPETDARAVRKHQNNWLGQANDEDIFKMSTIRLRRKMGMVFQRPTHSRP
jgi:phosphate transport system ATP-binding protein